DGVDIARVFGDIADADGLPGGCGGAGDSLADGDAQIFGQARRVADGKTMLEGRGGFIDHKHAEKFIVDVALDKNGSVRENLVKVQRGVDLFADFREGG